MTPPTPQQLNDFPIILSAHRLMINVGGRGRWVMEIQWGRAGNSPGIRGISSNAPDDVRAVLILLFFSRSKFYKY